MLVHGDSVYPDVHFGGPEHFKHHRNSKSRRPKREHTAMSKSRTMTLVATLPPASLHVRAPALSSAKPRLPSSPVLEQPARWWRQKDGHICRSAEATHGTSDSQCDHGVIDHCPNNPPNWPNDLRKPKPPKRVGICFTTASLSCTPRIWQTRPDGCLIWVYKRLFLGYSP